MASVCATPQIAPRYPKPEGEESAFKVDVVEGHFKKDRWRVLLLWEQGGLDAEFKAGSNTDVHNFMTNEAISQFASYVIAATRMKRKFIVRKITLVVAIALALGGSALPVSAFARSSAFGGDRVLAGANVDRSDRVLHSRERGRHAWVQRGNERDLWGHWGAYYGPMI
jgi:hypothetical protein